MSHVKTNFQTRHEVSAHITPGDSTIQPYHEKKMSFCFSVTVSSDGNECCTVGLDGNECGTVVR